MEYIKFLRTLSKIVLAAFVFMGPFEAFFHFAAQSEEVNVHYKYNSLRTASFEPLPGCSMPPMQPYSMMFVLEMTKFSGLAVMLPVKALDDLSEKPSLVKKVCYHIITFYQLVAVPITMILTVVHFATEMGPFDNAWDGYQCFGAMWFTGPWLFNAMLFAWKAALMMGMTGVCECPILCVMPDNYSSLRDSLLLIDDHPNGNRDWGPSTYQLARGNFMSVSVTAVVTLLPYMIVAAPFLLTHVFVSFIVYLPEVLLLMLVFSMIYFAGIYGTDLGFDVGNNPANPALMRTVRANIEVNGVHFLPILIGTSITLQILLFQAIYLYSGQGYLRTIGITWMERRTSIYLESFYGKVAKYLYSIANLTNEAV